MRALYEQINIQLPLLRAELCFYQVSHEREREEEDIQNLISGFLERVTKTSKR